MGKSAQLCRIHMPAAPASQEVNHASHEHRCGEVEVTGSDPIPRLSDGAITTISGSVSGFVATMAKQPLQRLKWIRQVESGPSSPYRTVFSKTVAADGVFGLFKGSTAAICRNVPHSILVYKLYPWIEHWLIERQ